MVQVLPKVPGFGELLGQAIGQGATNIGQGFVDRMINERDQNIIKSLGPNSTPSEILQASTKLSQRSQQGLMPLIEQYVKGQQATQLENQRLQIEREKAAQEEQDWVGTFESLRNKLPYVGTALPFTKAAFANLPWSEAAKEREAFDVAAFQLERYARAAHTKGALSTKVYESLLSKLPSSRLSEAKNLGRIEEWEKTLLKNQYRQEKEQAEKNKLETKNSKSLKDIFK